MRNRLRVPAAYPLRLRDACVVRDVHMRVPDGGNETRSGCSENFCEIAATPPCGSLTVSDRFRYEPKPFRFKASGVSR